MAMNGSGSATLHCTRQRSRQVLKKSVPFSNHVFLLSIQWNLEVQKKSDKDIYATYINGKVHFGENIPKPNKLCAVMEKEFRDWLRLMLLWDKTRRGGRTPLTKVVPVWGICHCCERETYTTLYINIL